ncbi:DUF7563 family protein [Haladaptatus sp. ZSTT2]
MPECNTCGEFVSLDFARVFGNNANEVRACLDCSTRNALQGGGPNRQRAD